MQEQAELASFTKASENSREKNLSVAKLQAFVMPLLTTVIGSSSVLTLVYGGYLAIHGEITVGQFVAFNSYIGMLVWPMIAAGECVTHVSQGMASVARVKKIFDEQPDIVDESNGTSLQLQGGITLRNLTFAYPGHEDTLALQNISVTVAPGETLAIVGRTGCGKSTLVNLLVRLYDV